MMELSKKAIKESGIGEWEEGREIEWGFNEGIGRLVIKGEGPLETYADGSKICQMKNHSNLVDFPWLKKFKKQIKSHFLLWNVFNW